MFNWYDGSMGISSVRRFSEYTVMDLWGSPLQGVCEFKTITKMLFAFFTVDICTEGR